MKIEHLYYFMEIVHAQSINKASNRLYISQQHLSRIVNALEKEFDVTLFKRTSKGITLTPQGENFYKYADKIVGLYDEMKKEFSLGMLPKIDSNEDLCGECRISFPFFFSLYLNDFLETIKKTYPEITVHYFEEYIQMSARNLEMSDRIHFISDFNIRKKSIFADEPNLKKFYIGQTELLFCVKENSKLSGKHMLLENDINNYMITSYPQLESYCDFINQEQILFTSSNIYQHLDSVVHNDSLCFVPSYCKRGILQKYPSIKCIPYEYTYPVPMYIVISQNLSLSSSEKAIISCIVRYINSLNDLA